jgi:hypothetical protein
MVAGGRFELYSAYPSRCRQYWPASLRRDETLCNGMHQGAPRRLPSIQRNACLSVRRWMAWIVASRPPLADAASRMMGSALADIPVTGFRAGKCSTSAAIDRGVNHRSIDKPRSKSHELWRASPARPDDVGPSRHRSSLPSDRPTRTSQRHHPTRSVQAQPQVRYAS